MDGTIILPILGGTILVGFVAGVLFVWIPRLRREALRRCRDQLGPEDPTFLHDSASHRRGHVSATGVLALATGRLLFVPWFGPPLQLNLQDVQTYRSTRSYKGKRIGGHQYTVLTWRDPDTGTEREDAWALRDPAGQQLREALRAAGISERTEES